MRSDLIFGADPAELVDDEEYEATVFLTEMVDLEEEADGVEEEFNELKQALDEEALSSFMKTDLPERIASALAAEAIPASPSQAKNKESPRVLIEFCCHPESELGKLPARTA